MEEQYLQVGFEIKLACDALSRRMLRWHWEKTSRPNTLQALMAYVEQRTQEQPEYYLHAGVQSGYTSWQQLDTTFCMRVLLDEEENAKNPKRLLQYALRDNTARRACNGLRLARNAAAHATEKAGVVKAIALFDETIDDLERAYGLTLFASDELVAYDQLIQKATLACGAAKDKKIVQQNKQEKAPKRSVASVRDDTKKVAPNKKKTVAQKEKNRGTDSKRFQPQGKTNTFNREMVFMCLGIVVFIAAIVAQCLH